MATGFNAQAFAPLGEIYPLASASQITTYAAIAARYPAIANPAALWLAPYKPSEGLTSGIQCTPVLG